MNKYIKCKYCGEDIIIQIRSIDTSTSSERSKIYDRPTIIQKCAHNNSNEINDFLKKLNQSK